MLAAGVGGHEEIRVVDFGISKPFAAAPDEGLTAAGRLVGTLAYMSPSWGTTKPSCSRRVG
jgi:serine/threonine protein kinase